MRFLSLFITFGCLGYGTGQLLNSLNVAYPWWFNQTIACNFCGQWTYGVVLSNDVETLISAMGLVLEYNWCPKYYPYITLDYCVNYLTNVFAFFYRPYYALNYPYRDYMCYGICGNSGENYTIT